MTVGERLRALRIQRGLTQQELAAQLKIDRSTLCKYETGYSEPKLDILRKVSKLFGVDYNYLLEDDV